MIEYEIYFMWITSNISPSFATEVGLRHELRQLFVAIFFSNFEFIVSYLKKSYLNHFLRQATQVPKGNTIL